VCLLRGTFYILRSAHKVCLCVLCGSENKQRLFHCTALTDWLVFITETECVARYGLNLTFQSSIGSAIAQLVSRLPLTTKTKFRFQDNPGGTLEAKWH
jgi:hypothetical protein